jgi:hypothetical protein
VTWRSINIPTTFGSKKNPRYVSLFRTGPRGNTNEETYPRPLENDGATLARARFSAPPQLRSHQCQPKPHDALRLRRGSRWIAKSLHRESARELW